MPCDLSTRFMKIILLVLSLVCIGFLIKPLLRPGFTVHVNRDWAKVQLYSITGPSIVCVPHPMTEMLQLPQFGLNRNISENEFQKYKNPHFFLNNKYITTPDRISPRNQDLLVIKLENAMKRSVSCSLLHLVREHSVWS